LSPGIKKEGMVAGEPKKRMPIEKEKQLAEKFYEYIDKCAK